MAGIQTSHGIGQQIIHAILQAAGNIKSHCTSFDYNVPSEESLDCCGWIRNAGSLDHFYILVGISDSPLLL